MFREESTDDLVNIEGKIESLFLAEEQVVSLYQQVGLHLLEMIHLPLFRIIE